VLMIQHISKTIHFCNELPYQNDDKLEKLETVQKELTEDYLIQHLRRYCC